jgi:hypothetical protein
MEVIFALFIVIVLLGTFPLHLKFWWDLLKDEDISMEGQVAIICFSLPLFPLIGIYKGISEILKRR